MGEIVCYAIVYFIEAVIAWMYTSHLYNQKYNSVFLSALYAIGYLALFVINRLWDITVVNTFSFFIVTALLTFLCFSCSLWAAIMHSAILSFIMTIAEILVGFVLSSVVGSFAASKSDFTVLIALCAISKLLYFLAAMAIAHLVKPQKNQEKDPVIVLLLSALPFATMLVADAVIYMAVTVSLEPFIAGIMITSVLALTLVDILVLVVYKNIQKITSENTRLQFAIQKDETEAHMYQTLRVQYDTQRALIHDIRHHQYVLTDMLRQGDSNQALDYLEQMSEIPAIKKRTLYCHNPILNTIVQRYAEYCLGSGIQFQCDIASACIDHLDDISITALFSNLLSNAYTASNNSSKKYIDLSVGPTGTGDAVIIVCNSCDTPPVKGKNGRFRTTKNDAVHHGIGLDSVSRIVEQYGGYMDMDYTPETQSVTISIFLLRST